jgi:hypothetical protein
VRVQDHGVIGLKRELHINRRDRAVGRVHGPVGRSNIEIVGAQTLTSRSNDEISPMPRNP